MVGFPFTSQYVCGGLNVPVCVKISRGQVRMVIQGHAQNFLVFLLAQALSRYMGTNAGLEQSSSDCFLEYSPTSKK